MGVKEEGRVCSKCGVWKGWEDYSRNKRSKNGRRTNCKQCKKEQDNRYREKNKEKIKALNREYHGKNKDKIKEYREKNRDKIKEYREKNRDKIKEKDKEYREKLPDGYVKKQIRQTLKVKNPPQELIEMYREYLLMHREIRRLKNGVIESGNSRVETDEQAGDVRHD